MGVNSRLTVNHQKSFLIRKTSFRQSFLFIGIWKRRMSIIVFLCVCTQTVPDWYQYFFILIRKKIAYSLLYTTILILYYDLWYIEDLFEFSSAGLLQTIAPNSKKSCNIEKWHNCTSKIILIFFMIRKDLNADDMGPVY